MNAIPPTARSRGRSPSFAALFSFVWPGTGQLYAGNRRLAAIFIAPTLLLPVLLAYQLRQGAVVFMARFADPSFCLGALAIVVLAGLWRLGAVAQAYFTGRRNSRRPILDRLILAGLTAIILVSHGFTGVILATTYTADSNIFNPSTNLLGDDLATPSPAASSEQSLGPTAAPTPTSTPAPDGRVTMLFTGVDSDPSRDTRSYDSLMVVSYDPTANTVQMVNVPREIAAFPFYFGGVDHASDWITYLPNYVRSGHIKGSPDSNYMTLVNEVQYLVGVHIDYWTVLNLGGFVKVIDVLGGVDVVNPSVISDPTYDWLDGSYGVYIQAGPVHLNGRYALAYARSRHGGGNDYKRAARQQQIMLALLHKMSQPGAILHLNDIISRVGSMVQTGSTSTAKQFKPSMVADYIADAENVPTGNFTNVVLGPPYTTSIPSYLANGKSSICLHMPAAAAESIKLFGRDSLWYNQPTPTDTCPK